MKIKLWSRTERSDTMTATSTIRTETTEPKLDRRRFGLEKEWYHGLKSLADYEALLEQDGDFLVRLYQSDSEGEKSPARQVLTVLWNGQPYHFIINEASKGTVYIVTYEFESVPQMIDFYWIKQISITRNSGVNLFQAIPRTKLQPCAGNRLNTPSTRPNDCNTSIKSFPCAEVPLDQMWLRDNGKDGGIGERSDVFDLHGQATGDGVRLRTHDLQEVLTGSPPVPHL